MAENAVISVLQGMKGIAEWWVSVHMCAPQVLLVYLLPIVWEPDLKFQLEVDFYSPSLDNCFIFRRTE